LFFDFVSAAPIITEHEARYGCELLIYGSVATGVDTIHSDLDILAIGLERGREFEISSSLSAAFEREVSVARTEDLFHLLAPRIRNEARSVSQLTTQIRAGDRPAPCRKSPLLYLHGIEEAAYAILHARSKAALDAGSGSDDFDLSGWLFAQSIRSTSGKVDRFNKRLHTVFGNVHIAFPSLPWASIRMLARFARLNDDDTLRPRIGRGMSRLKVAQARKAARHVLRWRIKLDLETVIAHTNGVDVEWMPITKLKVTSKKKQLKNRGKFSRNQLKGTTKVGL
jgi:predicted nucleotidyltransferase